MTTTKILNAFIIATFLAAICLPLVFLEHKTNIIREKRNKASFPKTEDWQNWRTASKKIEAYYNDRFGLRSYLIFAYSLLHFQFGISPSEKVLIGKEGWLFFTDQGTLDDYRGNKRFSETQLKRWKKYLETKYYGLKSIGIDYVFVIAPNKHSIYGEYLPSRIRKVSNQSYIDQLIAYMHRSEVPILDLRPGLLAAKKTGRLYEQGGTHWNSLGANHAQYLIAAYLKKEKFPEIQPVLFMPDKYIWERGNATDLAIMINLNYLIYEDHPQLKKSFTNQKTTQFNKNRFFLTENNTAPDIKALIFHDSFFEKLAPYTSQYFSESVYVWKRISVFSFMKDYLSDAQPDIVIEEIAERFLKSYKLPAPHPKDSLFYPVWQQLQIDK